MLQGGTVKGIVQASFALLRQFESPFAHPIDCTELLEDIKNLGLRNGLMSRPHCALRNSVFRICGMMLGTLREDLQLMCGSHT